MSYPIGAYFVTTVPGATGWLIGVGQALCGRPSRYMHCGVIVTDNGATIEAQPGGAREGSLADYAGRAVLVCDGPIRRAVHADGGRQSWAEVALRRRVADEAVKLKGTPYSALDYVALACLHLRLPSRWIRDRVRTSGHAICSQLVTIAYTRAGIDLFTDGRYPGDVMPADLADWADTWLEQRQEAAA